METENLGRLLVRTLPRRDLEVIVFGDKITQVVVIINTVTMFEVSFDYFIIRHVRMGRMVTMKYIRAVGFRFPSVETAIDNTAPNKDVNNW